MMDDQTIRILAGLALVIGALIVGIVVNIQTTRRHDRNWTDYFQTLAMINVSLSEIREDIDELELKLDFLIDPRGSEPLSRDERLAAKSHRLEINATDSMRGDDE